MYQMILLLFLFSLGCKSDNNANNLDKNAAISVDTNNLSKEIIDTMGIAYLMGKFDPKEDKRFEEIPTIYADRDGLYIRKEVFLAYKNMYDAAKSKGIVLQIKSATRNFDYQKRIWERKWTGETRLSDGTNLKTANLSEEQKALKILEYSSMPGTSRHHWGTDIDLNNFTNSWFENGEGKIIYDWLNENAVTYGFVQVYTPIGPDRQEGYQEEKWHWSYKPISSKLLLEAKEHLKNEDISGFLGSQTAESIDVVGKYVLGVNKNCY